MNDSFENDWLSLSDAAQLLGIHPSTVRNWSDKGILPVYRTKGGHRRYRRKEVELWAQSSRQSNHFEPEGIMHQTVGQVRVQIAEGQLEAEGWYQKLDQEAREQYRRSARTLLQGLLSSISSNDDESKSEAYAIGYEYASRARRYGLSYIDAARAFMFFRSILLESLVQVYMGANVLSTQAWERMLNKVHGFTDHILLTLLETYQTLENANQ